jgi:hypothetical protein
MEPLYHTAQRRRGLVLSALIALALATFAAVPATTPAAKPAPTLHDVQLDGTVTSWSGVSGPLGGPACRSMTVDYEGQAFGFGAHPKRGRFTSTATVTCGPFDPVFSDPAPVTDFTATIEIKTGPRRAVVTLLLGSHEVIGQCIYSPGGETGRASGTVDYTATITGPHGTVRESGTATIEMTAGQSHSIPSSPSGVIHVHFN